MARTTGSTIALRPTFVVQATGWVVLGLIALVVLDRSRHVLALVLVALVLAALLRAPIDALSRNLPRWAAIAAVAVGLLVSLGGLLTLSTMQVRQEVDDVGDSITQRIDDVDPDSALGEFLDEAKVAERIDEHLGELPTRILIGSSDAADGARLGLEALLVIMLALYALVNAERIARPLLGGDRPSWWAEHVRQGVRVGASQVRRLLGVAVVSGLIGLATAWTFGLPGSTALAWWVGVWAVVPIFGPIVGYAPLIVLASLDGWPQAVSVTVIGILLASASWYVDHRVYTLRRGAGPRTGPLGLAVALVIGLRFDWIIGPLVGVFVVTAVIATLDGMARRLRSDGGDAPDDRPSGSSTWNRLEWRSAGRATAIVVLVVALIAFVIDLAPAPIWIVIGLTLSIALDPLVGWIADHTPLGRGTSIAAVIAGVLIAVSAALLFAVPSVARSVRDLDAQMPKIAADLERLPLIGGELAERGVAERLQTTVEELPERLASDTGPIEGALRSAGDGLIATFWVLLITVTALIDGRRARRGLRSLVKPERRQPFDRVDTVVGRVIARYAVGSLVVAAIAGTAAFVVALVGGVPLAPLLGLWAGVTNLIPQVGGYLGAAPLLILGLTTGTTNGLIVFGVYLAYMQIENRVIQPLIVSKTVDIPPFVSLVVALVGAAAGGVVGAVLVTPLVAVAKSLHEEFGPARTQPKTPR